MASIYKISGERFIFAAGSWTGKILGPSVPVEPVKGQILIFKLPEKPEFSAWETPVFCGRSPAPDSILCYMTPKKDGHLLVGATMEKKGFDKSENKPAVKAMVNHLTPIFSRLDSLPFKGTWVGLRPGSPDGLPLLGPLPDYQNLYIASGHSRNGILLSALTGKVFAELMLEGKTTFPLTAFSPGRFKK